MKNGDVGYAQFIKGWNGRFKILQSGHGTNEVSYRSIKTNIGMYGVLIGRNSNLEISKIKAELLSENYSFTSDVSKDETFLRYKKLPSNLKQTFPAELFFYDENNKLVR